MFGVEQRDLILTDAEFKRIVDYVKSNYGINLKEKKVITDGRLRNYLAAKGYPSYEAYMNAVQADKTGIEEKNLVNMLTTNHTFFMREFEQMEYFRNIVLPDLKKSEERTRDLRIWCGASSSGEEPYTIAMVLMDFFGYSHAQWDTKVLATDISTKMLTHAVKGVYSNDQLINLPDAWRSKYFKPVGETQCMATDALKNQVMYRYLNLMNPLPFRKKLHMVFLRNVMIYFEDKTKIDLLQRIYDSMEPGAYLFVGATEVIDKSQTKLQYIKPSIYRK